MSINADSFSSGAGMLSTMPLADAKVRRDPSLSCLGSAKIGQMAFGYKIVPDDGTFEFFQA